MEARAEDGLIGGVVAAVLSGAPSTAYALVRGRDPLEATAAAGSMLLPNEDRRERLLLAAVPVHLAISLGWGIALAGVLPREREPLWGALGGAGIAVFDLLIVGRLFPRIRALETGPQIADHVAFGAIVGMVLSSRRRARAA